MQVKFTATDEVQAAVSRLGRTEDAQISPSGKRLVIAGYEQNRLMVVDIDLHSGQLAISNPLEISSPSLSHPHGTCWVDDRTLIVANRSRGVTIFEVPIGTRGSITLDPVREIAGRTLDYVHTPGSVSVHPIGLGVVELLVGNNYADTVSRHLLDQRDGYTLIASEILIARGLSVPDGVAHSPSGRWIAVSNHNSRSVFIYRNDGSLGPSSNPDGVLIGIECPHGLRFSEDEKSLLVADAGAPFVHLFSCTDGNWAGDRRPTTSLQVIDDEAFARGSYNPEEGGPKGVDITRDGRLMVASNEEVPLGFFDVSDLLKQNGRPTDWPTNLSEVDRARNALLRILKSSRSSLETATLAAIKAKDDEVSALQASTSWKLTAPLRQLSAAMRSLVARPRDRERKG